MSVKRMGGLGKLSDFGRSSPTPPTAPTTPVVSEPEPSQPEAEIGSPPAKLEEPRQIKKTEKPVTINIKIAREQQDWLADTARQVRDNNPEPVPAGDRCYPQHLIQVAIDLLAAASVDWAKIHNAEDLRKELNL